MDEIKTIQTDSECQTVTEKEDLYVRRMDSAKQCIESGTELMNATSDALTALEGNLNAINNCLQSAQMITSTVVNGITTWKEIDKQMHEMDVQFGQFTAELNANLDKYKTRIPLIEKQLDNINSNLTKMLDFILAMDAKTPQEMEFRMVMMGKIDNFLNTISTTLMALL